MTKNTSDRLVILATFLLALASYLGGVSSGQMGKMLIRSIDITNQTGLVARQQGVVNYDQFNIYIDKCGHYGFTSERCIDALDTLQEEINIINSASKIHLDRVDQFADYVNKTIINNEVTDRLVRGLNIIAYFLLLLAIFRREGKPSNSNNKNFEKNTMRVLIFSTAYYPFVGGAEVAIKEITDRAKDIEFDMITARLDSKLSCFERIGNVNVYRVGFGFKHFDKWWLMKFGGWKAWWLNRKNKYNVSWSMMASWGGLAAWWFKVLVPSVALILTLQEGDDISTRKFGLVAGGWKLILKKVNHLTVISNYLGELARKYGYKGEITLVPNGVDVEKFSRKYVESASIRKQFTDKGAKTILIHTGRLVEKNGLEYVIRALIDLPDDVHFLSVGRGDLLTSLKNLALEQKVSERVHFVDYVDHGKLPAYLQASDIFIRPSLSEGMGNSFIEAMAAGLPVIATNVGGIPDFLKDEETGLFCKVKNSNNISEQVQRIINSTEIRGKIIRGGRDAAEEYEWDIIAEKMKSVLILATSR